VAKIDELKDSAARAALDLVTDGMRLGLGTGSTASRFVAALGERVAAGLNVICVPTSEATRAQAERLNIPLTTLDQTPQLDLTVDGADEIDGQLRMIKGGGGALLREKRRSRPRPAVTAPSRSGPGRAMRRSSPTRAISFSIAPSAASPSPKCSPFP